MAEIKNVVLWSDDDVTAWLDEPVCLSATFYFEPPQWKAQKGKREAALRGQVPHMVKPDTDNLIKIVKDSLNGIVWRDDTNVVDLVNVRKRYSDQPRTEIKIERWNP